MLHHACPLALPAASVSFTFTSATFCKTGAKLQSPCCKVLLDLSSCTAEHNGKLAEELCGDAGGLCPCSLPAGYDVTQTDLASKPLLSSASKCVSFAFTH